MHENNSLMKKAKTACDSFYSKAEKFFSHDYFIAFLFIFFFCYMLFFAQIAEFKISEHVFLVLLSFAVSVSSIFLLFKFNKVVPVIALGGFLIFFSFFFQRFDLGVEYNLFYYIGFGVIASSIVYALIAGKKNFFWISLFVLFFASLSPLITPQILIGDERVLLSNLIKLETGEFKPSDFGEHNYVNVSFVYFYYLVIIAKIFGVSVAGIFFLLKFFFLVLIFLSFYLLLKTLVGEKLAFFAVLIAFFPIQNIHLAPQMLGKYIIFLVFIYFYLKYFRQLNSRIILVGLMLLITYINLTTLYITVAVFGFFVAIFFFKKAISRKAYFTDIIIFLMFTVLVATYSSSIDLFGLTSSYAGIDQEDFISITDANTSAEKIVTEEELSAKADPFGQKRSYDQTQQNIVPEESLKNVPFIRRLVTFFNNYVFQFGIFQLIEKLIHYSLVALLVITAFFIYPKNRQIGVFALAVFFLVLFLIHIQFQDGVHASLEVTSVLLGGASVLVFHKKPFYFIPLILLAFSSVTAPLLFNETQYGEASQLFGSEFSRENIIGEKLTPVNQFSSWSINEYYTAFGFAVSCDKGKPYEIYLNDVYVRCDDFGRIGSIGKKVYENQYSMVYVVFSQELIEFSS